MSKTLLRQWVASCPRTLGKYAYPTCESCQNHILDIDSQWRQADADNHVLYDVRTQTDCTKRAIVCTKKCNLFETFSCFVLDFLLSLQPKIDAN